MSQFYWVDKIHFNEKQKTYPRVIVKYAPYLELLAEYQQNSMKFSCHFHFNPYMRLYRLTKLSKSQIFEAVAYSSHIFEEGEEWAIVSVSFVSYIAFARYR